MRSGRGSLLGRRRTESPGLTWALGDERTLQGRGTLGAGASQLLSGSSVARLTGPAEERRLRAYVNADPRTCADSCELRGVALRHGLVCRKSSAG